MNQQENCSCSKDRIIFPVIQEDSSCCPTYKEDRRIIPGLDQSFVTGSIQTAAGRIPQVSAEWQSRDYWGTIKARWGIGRYNYRIDPGLYALGNPDNNSPVLVTASYKMSFDKLKRELPGRNLWILVLDTKGINVWCAAGHGTFGTKELIERIDSSGLKNIVTHRKLIVPQLGAPGVAAHEVKRFSGFKVHYGPIRAKNLPAYLNSGGKATPAMRIMDFPLKERAVLIPIEGVYAVKRFLVIAPVLFILSGIGGPAGFWTNTINYGLFSVIALLAAIFSGAVLNPLLLPYLPGRAFSTKGFFIGIVASLVLLYLRDADLQTWTGKTEALAWLLMIPAISSFLAMNFTGASTYTSLSGVKKEMRWALPAQITAACVGFTAWIISRLIA